MCLSSNRAIPKKLRYSLTHHFHPLLSTFSSSSLSMEEDKHPPSLSSSTSSSTFKKSPEFEFWMVRNLPSFPQTNFVSADKLFVDGVLLPLDLVSHHSDVVFEATQQQQDKVVLVEETEPDPEPCQLSLAEPESIELTVVSSASKRWRDIFRKGEKKSTVVVEDKEKNIKEKEKKKDRKSVSSNNGVSSGTELNINIWPFSRSWSAGTGANRSKLGGGSVTRKISSAPCSRSNSTGESKSKKWPNSPSRTSGIHLGRNSPVWHVKPSSGSGLRNVELVVRNVEKNWVGKDGLVKAKNKSNRRGGAADVGANKSKGLNLNVPMCIGYRQQLSCRRDESTLIDGGGGCSNNSSGSVGGGCNNNSAGAIGGNTLFNLRTLFTKKVY